MLRKGERAGNPVRNPVFGNDPIPARSQRMLLCAVVGFLEADSPPLGLWRGHEGAYGVKDGFELRVVFSFQGVKSCGKVLV